MRCYIDRKMGHKFQQNFNFQGLPLDITTQILVLAIATSDYWRTYQSLVVVSREMQALVYDTCLPFLPVMLHTKKHVDSFCLLLASHGTPVGRHIHSLWFIAGIKADVERTTGLSILNACAGITHLACRINLLSALVRQPGDLVLQKLRHLTLVEPIVPWQLLLRQPAAHQLFTQLTHLRVSGGTEFAKPDFCFASLSHLSFACGSLSRAFNITSRSTSPFPSAQFPVLQQIVPSMLYNYWRSEDPKTIHASGLAIDGRMDVLACPKKWKEADMWENARRGGNDLWTCVCAGEFIQTSEASATSDSALLQIFRYYDDLGRRLSQ